MSSGTTLRHCGTDLGNEGTQPSFANSILHNPLESCHRMRHADACRRNGGRSTIVIRELEKTR